eukprot:GEMP01038173.1.p1 GENE.GEMP01038173.1~~GEMP01038173.1.p1  ORF type:complete len:457 (+),score=93.19 GEMP01038173.1:262-1632(+)
MLDHVLTSFLNDALPAPPIMSSLQLWLQKTCDWHGPDGLHPEIRLPAGAYYRPGDLIHVTLEPYPTKAPHMRFWDATYKVEKDEQGWTIPQKAPAVTIDNKPHVDFHMPCPNGKMSPQVVLSAWGVKPGYPRDGQACPNLAEKCDFVGTPITRKSDLHFRTSCVTPCRDFLTNCLDSNCTPDNCPGCTALFAAQKRPWLTQKRLDYRRMFGDLSERYLWSTTVAQEVHDTNQDTASQLYISTSPRRQFCETTMRSPGDNDTSVDVKETDHVSGEWLSIVQPHRAKGITGINGSVDAGKVELMLRLKPKPADPDDLQFSLNERTRNCSVNAKPAECEQEIPNDHEILSGFLKPTANPGEWQMKRPGMKVTITARGNEVVYEGHHVPEQDDEPSDTLMSYKNDGQKTLLLDSAKHGIGVYNFHTPPSFDHHGGVFAPPLTGTIECSDPGTLPTRAAVL